MNFTHLHVHSAYSLLDSMVRIGSLADAIKEHGQTACALTDHGTLAGAVKFTDAMLKRGLKPILGMEAYIAPDSMFRKKYAKGEHYASHLILLAKTAEGWDNLRTLSSLSFVDGFYRKPRIDHALLAKHSRGLIATTACMGGDVSVYLKAGLDADGEGKVAFDPELASAKMAWYASIFEDRFFIELQEHGHETQSAINDWYRAYYPQEMTFASADCHYIKQEDWDTHDTLLCCGIVKQKNDPDRWKFPSQECWLKSTEEMSELFYPQEIENAYRIGESIDFILPLRKQWFMPELPAHVTRHGQEAVEEVFTRECLTGLVTRYHGKEFMVEANEYPVIDIFEELPQVYQDRLNYEMSVFIKAGFVEYTLILWDLMRYCESNDIFTGDGRGSGAGSLVLYALGITNVDPVHRDCPFERFINPGRLENFAPPDVDLDFPKSRRGDVISYLRETYGAERVCQIGTYASLGPAGLIRKLGIPLGISHDIVNKLTAIIPEGEASQQGSGAASEEHGLNLDEVYKQSEQFRILINGLGEIGRWLMFYARGLQNLGTHSSTHASGVIITNRPVGDIIPLMVANANDPKKRLVLGQMDMFDIEAMGLVKFDILGLDTLDVLADAQRMIRANEDPNFDFRNIDLDDPGIYDLLCAGRTVGVFQASGGGFGRLLAQAQPRSVEDLAVLTSLCRPGPTLAGATESYLKRRQGSEQVTYTINELEPILGKNLGVLAFQEDIMAIAHQLAGFSLAEADELRKAMGKKDMQKMEKQRPQFIQGMDDHGISPHDAEKLWDQLVPMAQYVFNRSHAMAYSYLTAKTAYAKVHYPGYFLAAAMSADTSGTNSGANLPLFVRDAQISGCYFFPPEINSALAGYQAMSSTNIMLGLLSVHGVGQSSVDAILEERNRNGIFKSRQDFRDRIAPRAANKAVLEALVQSGAFDRLEGTHREKTVERLNQEFALFGFYLSGHPIAELREQWEEEVQGLASLADIESDNDKERVMYHGKFGRKYVFKFREYQVRTVVSKVTKKKSKGTGKFMLMLEIEDETGGMKMIVNAGQIQKFGNPSITKGSVLHMHGRKEDGNWAGYFSPSQLVVL